MPKFSKKKDRNGRRKTRILYRNLTPKVTGGSLAGGEVDHPIFTCDSYKVVMCTQYPPDVTEVYSYIEARSKGEYTHTVFFGLQAYILEYLMIPLTEEILDKATTLWQGQGIDMNKLLVTRVWNGTDQPDTKSLYDLWKELIGKPLPIEITSVDEGSVLPIGLPLVAIRNTNPDYFWLPTWLETSLLRAIWYPTTVATQSRSIKNVIQGVYDKCGLKSVDAIDFQLHDFGARGVSSLESGGLGGAAHLINFNGTDTFSGALAACKYYGARNGIGLNRNNELTSDKIKAKIKLEDLHLLWGTTIPATEHSTMTSWGNRTISTELAHNKTEIPADTKALLDAVDANYLTAENGYFWDKKWSRKVTYVEGGETKTETLTGHGEISKPGTYAEYIKSETEGTAKGEEAAFINHLLNNPANPVSTVSDSYDIYNAVYNYWGGTLKPLVKARTNAAIASDINETKGTHHLVVRPDSGDPLTLCCRLVTLLGLRFNDPTEYTDYEGSGESVLTTEGLGESVLTIEGPGEEPGEELVEVKRGGGDKYRVLKYARIIQGDGVSEESITSILNAITGNFQGSVVTSTERKYKEGDKKGDYMTFSNMKEVVALTDDEINADRWSPVLFGIFGSLTMTIEQIKDMEKYQNWCDGEKAIFDMCWSTMTKSSGSGKTFIQQFLDDTKWSPAQFVFGMGGKLLQIINRDTQRWAMKCSAIKKFIDKLISEYIGVTKDPITDQGKQSKTGAVKAFSKVDGENDTNITYEYGVDDSSPIFKVKFYDGELKDPINFKQVRDNSNKYTTTSKRDITSKSFKVKDKKANESYVEVGLHKSSVAPE